MRQRTLARVGSGLMLLAIAVPPCLVAQATPIPGMVLGTVRDTLGRPVGQVEIVVTGTSIVSRSTDDGLYLLVDVPPGRVPLLIRRIGFEPIAAEITLSPGTEMRVDIDLTPTPQMLDEVEVAGIRGIADTKLDDFHRRRQTANGFFLTQEQIEKRGMSTPIDLLRTMHRVRIIPLRSSSGSLIRIGTGKAQCAPAIYLDGLKVNEAYIDAIPIERIIAVEVYPRAVDVPLPYQGALDCGVIGFWMRMGPVPARENDKAKQQPKGGKKRDA
ncbi:MAG TPA: carboxypeptidase regulatory-like domain-containing protein [Gemmatimonadaceae bacterium]|nr:carboxypeptidase regulatory-like domain-containing protein [Gemmatimonadaceae bacterium]